MTLVMLDLNAAFDTGDHDVLLDILQRRFAVTETPLQWFRSYLSGRTQVFCSNQIHSATYTLDSSVPRCSVLGPVKFITYTEDIAELFHRHELHYHIYADDKHFIARQCADAR